MNKVLPLDIVGSSKFSRYDKISRESTYNMIISDGALVPAPGYRKITDIIPGRAAGRANYTSSKYGHNLVVVDDGVYLITSNFSAALIGRLDTLSGDVFIAENNANQIVFTQNTTFVYVFDFVQNRFDRVNVGFPIGRLTFIDGYIVAPHLGTSEWRLSSLNNAKSFPFDAQHVAELQTAPDTVIACETLERQLYVFGRNVTEVWLDIPTGSSLFPFQRQNSLSIEYGCLSPNTIASNFHRMVWLGNNKASGPVILVSDGGAPRKIETDGINFVLDNLTDPENSHASLFEEDGHIYYLITFETDNISYLYDFNEDKFYNATDHTLNAHIARNINYFNKAHIFVTSKDGGLYELSSNLSTYKETTQKDDEGFTIPRIRITKPTREATSMRFLINNAQIMMEQGYSDKPLDVGISLSKDGAASFGSMWKKALARLGRRANKMLFRQLGAANDVTFRFDFIGKDRFVINGATMEINEQ